MSAIYTSLISTKELNQLLTNSDCKIFDTRHSLSNLDFGHDSYNESHLPNAIFAHLDKDLSGEIIQGKTGRHPLPTKEDWVERLRKWGIQKEDQLVIYDQNHGGIAARMWWMMKWVGHEKVAVLEGGIQKWKEDDYPLSQLKPTIVRSDYLPSQALTSTTSLDEVLELAKKPDTNTLIDSRAAKRYAGIEEPIDPIAGHIPQAINRPFTQNLNKDFTWKNDIALRSEFDQLFKNPKELTFYCGSGVTACHNILSVYKAYGIIPKLYPGSWSEYLIYGL